MRSVTREPIATTSLARKLMTERRWVDVDDFATDCEREAMEMNPNQRSDGECRWTFGRSCALVRPRLQVVQAIVCDTMVQARGVWPRQ